VERARAGYAALDQWVKQVFVSGAGKGSGTFVSLWRMLLEYPEILEWHKFWCQSVAQ